MPFGSFVPFQSQCCGSFTFFTHFITWSHPFPPTLQGPTAQATAMSAASKTKAMEDNSRAHFRPWRSDHEANIGAAVNSEKLRRALMRPGRCGAGPGIVSFNKTLPLAHSLWLRSCYYSHPKLVCMKALNLMLFFDSSLDFQPWAKWFVSVWGLPPSTRVPRPRHWLLRRHHNQQPALVLKPGTSTEAAATRLWSQTSLGLGLSWAVHWFYLSVDLSTHSYPFTHPRIHLPVH